MVLRHLIDKVQHKLDGAVLYAERFLSIQHFNHSLELLLHEVVEVFYKFQFESDIFYVI